MVNMNDQSIIDNTHFKEQDGNLICYTNLPDGDKFAQAVSSEESVQKNMIGWCNTVRDYVAQKEAKLEAEREEARKARGTPKEKEIVAPEASQAVSEAPMDTKGQILQYYDELQDKIEQLGIFIDDMKAERDELRDERDKLAPIITVWRGE